jgi:ABC-type phosphate transport system substrate-binding protein
MLLLTALMPACGNAADKNTSSNLATTQVTKSAIPTASVTPNHSQNIQTNPADSQKADNQPFPPGIDATSLGANLNGSGSTLISPALKVWQQEFGKLAPKVRINYQAGGSGQGRSDVLTGKTEFGVSDVQLTKDEASKTGHKFENYIQIPATLAAIVLIYNLPGVPELHLDPQVLGEIYTGKIKKWNNSKIKQDNPNAHSYVGT